MKFSDLEKLFGNTFFESGYIIEGHSKDFLGKHISNYYGKGVLVIDTHYCEGKKEKDNISVNDVERILYGIFLPGDEEQYKLRNPFTKKEQSFFYSDLVGIFVMDICEEHESKMD